MHIAALEFVNGRKLGHVEENTSEIKILCQ